jgi:hypothetical protein
VNIHTEPQAFARPCQEHLGGLPQSDLTNCSPREAAEFYLSEFGWLTVPCRVAYVDGRKRTRGLPRNYPALKRGPISWDRIAKLWTSKSAAKANAVAHVLRPGVLVVDLDGPSAENWLAGREFNPDVPCLKTGNGRHYLFRCPPGWDFDLLRFPVGSEGSQVECLVGRLQFVPPCPDGRRWLALPVRGGALPLVPQWLHDEIKEALRLKVGNPPSPSRADECGEGEGMRGHTPLAVTPERVAAKRRGPADFGAVLDALELAEWRLVVPDLAWNGEAGAGSCPLHDDSQKSFSLYRRRRGGALSWNCHSDCPPSFTGVRGGEARHGGNLRDLRRAVRIKEQRTEEYERAAGAIFKLDLPARARRLILLVLDKARHCFLDLREPVGFSYREAALGGLDQLVPEGVDALGRPRTKLRYGGGRIRRAMADLRAVGVNIVKGEQRCADEPFGITTTFLFPASWLVHGPRVPLLSSASAEREEGGTADGTRAHYPVQMCGYRSNVLSGIEDGKVGANSPERARGELRQRGGNG